jgi:hypothetical protein
MSFGLGSAFAAVARRGVDVVRLALAMIRVLSWGTGLRLGLVGCSSILPGRFYALLLSGEVLVYSVNEASSIKGIHYETCRH